jgi:hypothetical protein
VTYIPGRVHVRWRRSQVRALCDAYGLDPDARWHLTDAVIARQAWNTGWLQRRGVAAVAAWSDRERAFTRAHADARAAAL